LIGIYNHITGWMQGSTSSPALANLTENSVILVISWCGRNMFRWSRGAISPVKGKPEGDFGQRTRAMAFVSSFTSWGGKGPPIMRRYLQAGILSQKMIDQRNF
jgi:hypothetical protein